MDSFKTKSKLTLNDRTFHYYSLPALEAQGHDIDRLPYSIRIVLENLLRNENGISVFKRDITNVLQWDAQKTPSDEIAFSPSRVLMQDFTGVPAIVDLASMREAMIAMGGDPSKINPQIPTELVIDHSVQVDYAASASAEEKNTALEFERNMERYQFLKWGQMAFKNFKVVPPSTGIVHQVNLEYLGRVVSTLEEVNGDEVLCPDTLVGTDSHTTMINGLGVLGWGVGGIEAEACLLGQPTSMLLPQVVGVKLLGALPKSATATDLVLRVTEMLRKHGVVGKFVEFFGEGLQSLSLADRATIANMAPEYGATCGIFPVDEKTLDYLRLSGRSEEHIAKVSAYMKAQKLFYDPQAKTPDFTSIIELHLSSIEPSLAGPKRPQDRLALGSVATSFKTSFPEASETKIDEFGEGSVVIAAITSCTNTSNPSVLIAAGLVAKKAVERKLKIKPWVKPSFAPGSRVVHEYLKQAGLLPFLNDLGFNIVGYGCTTCIGNSGPIKPELESAITQNKWTVASVLSGNRNFEGRVHAKVKANYLASPPLVVAYALAGNVRMDLTSEPIAKDGQGKDVYLRDLWPTPEEIEHVIQNHVQSKLFIEMYKNVFEGQKEWQDLKAPDSATYAWDTNSTYIAKPPFFQNIQREPSAIKDIRGARVLALLGNSITTDHISPAGSISPTSPAGIYLKSRGVEPKDFNQYGARRGNHEVMMRGTFANVRIKNLMLSGVEGGQTLYIPENKEMSIWDAAALYQARNIPLVVIAGKEYGTGSSRDWAAKGPYLQGVRVVIAESFERIHRSNLVGMGILPLEFVAGINAQTLGLTGKEIFEFLNLQSVLTKPQSTLQVSFENEAGQKIEFSTLVRIDTPQEVHYYHHGGILPFVLRKIANG